MPSAYPSSDPSIIYSSNLPNSAAGISYLPEHVIEPILQLLDARKQDDSIYYEVTCEIWGDYSFRYGRVDFGFGNLTISVPVRDLMFFTQAEKCILGVTRTTDPMVIPYVLGEPFLRNAFGRFTSIFATIPPHSLS